MSDYRRGESQSPALAPSRSQAILTWFLYETGLLMMWNSSRDVKYICAQRFVRLFAHGASTLVLVPFLSGVGMSDYRIGLFMTLTQVWDVVISFFLPKYADEAGRKITLLMGALLVFGSGFVFAISSNYWILLAASVVGVISPSGYEVGPFAAIEQSIVAQLTPTEMAADAFTRYSLLGIMGTALGQLTSGWIMSSLQSVYGWDFVPAARVIFAIYAFIGLLKSALCVVMSPRMEAPQMEEPREQQNDEASPLLAESSTDSSQDNRQAQTVLKSKVLMPGLEQEALFYLVLQLYILLGLDAFASGLSTPSWIASFFFRKFHMPEKKLGSILFVSNCCSAVGMLSMASLARRVGNIKALVMVNLPSSICLALIAIPNSLPLALTFFVLRVITWNMDVAPRNAFVSQSVPPKERTFIMGKINVIRGITTSVGPLLTGIMVRNHIFGLSLVLAGILKGGGFTLGLWFCFGGKEAAQRKRITKADETQESS